MTNKRFDWMTPEEAARELEGGDRVWCADMVFPVAHQGFVGYEPNEIFVNLVLPPFPFNHFYKICRAIVPEVPSE